MRAKTEYVNDCAELDIKVGSGGKLSQLVKSGLYSLEGEDSTDKSLAGGRRRGEDTTDGCLLLLSQINSLLEGPSPFLPQTYFPNQLELKCAFIQLKLFDKGYKTNKLVKSKVGSPIVSVREQHNFIRHMIKYLYQLF